MDAKTNALAILEGIKKAGIDLITSLPDINCLDLINALEDDSAIAHHELAVGRARSLRCRRADLCNRRCCNQGESEG